MEQRLLGNRSGDTGDSVIDQSLGVLAIGVAVDADGAEGLS